MGKIIKECITCGEKGHTYLECDKVNFGSLLCGVFGVEPLLGPSISETIENINELNVLNNGGSNVIKEK